MMPSLTKLMNDDIRINIDEKTFMGKLEDDGPKMDVLDPSIVIDGFRTMKRSTAIEFLYRRLDGLTKSLRSANTPEQIYTRAKSLRDSLDPRTGEIFATVQALIDVAEELEAIRSKGGRRDVPIPKQI
jgi:hypothetical protein